MRMVRASSSKDAVTEVPKPQFSNIGPEPQKFSVQDGMMGDVIGAAMAPLLRGGVGVFNMGYKVALAADDDKYAVLRTNGQKVLETSDVGSFPRPVLPLELYEYEGCPFCKKVRECFSLLDLDVLVRPTPQNGAMWRVQAIERGGKKMFPFLCDPNTRKEMYESDDIISYLFDTYGPGKEQIPLGLRMGPLTTLSCGLGLIARGGAGNKAREVPGRQPAQPLEFWGYEGSPFVKVARETLCELELPYMQRTCARGSPKRQELIDRMGAFQVPFLADPNTGVCMFESKAIREYLNKEYGTPVVV
ncbi:hypothetical protein FOA52_016289 [Chlamydomonas sp. UWO 241]|nr:hypothetical protein FOA52_016289 [Chlamydomonas sp. UWO 241]